MEPVINILAERGRGVRQRPPRRTALTRLRGWLWAACWACGAWLASWRRPVAEPAHVERQQYRDSTQRIGVRMNETLRDRARPRWLRRSDADAPPR